MPATTASRDATDALPQYTRKAFARPREVHRFGPHGTHAKCVLCNIHFHPVRETRDKGFFDVGYDRQMDDTEAQASIDAMIGATKADLAYVKEKLRTHGTVIVTRWTKKSQDKRGRLLSDAAKWCFGEWPQATSMSNEPESVSLRNRVAAMLPKSWEKDNHFQWGPWIHTTDLAKDSAKLLSLLNVRTAYPQQDWAMFDTDETELCFDASMTLSPYNPKGVQMYGEGFGRLMDFDVELAHARAMLGFPRAYITFLAQQAIARMIRNVIDAITVNAAPSGDSKWLGLLSDNFRGNWNSSEDSGSSKGQYARRFHLERQC